MQSKKGHMTRKRTAALLLCLFMLIPSMSSSANSISETESKISQLQSEKAELDSKLAELKGDESKAIAYKETLEEKITNIESQIDEARKQIETLDGEILVLESKLEKSEEEMGDTLQQFYNSVKALYTSGSNVSLGTLEILLNSDSLYEFSLRNEAMKTVSAYNQEIADKITAYVEETQDERTECQEKKEEVAQLKVDLEANQAELEDLYTENQEALLEIQRLELDYETQISTNNAEREELDAKLDQLVAEESARLKAEEEAAAAAAADNTSSGSSTSNSDTTSSGGSTSNSDTTSSGDSSSSGKTSSSTGSDSGSNSSTTTTTTTTTTTSTSSSSTSFAWPIPGVYTITQHFGNNGHNGIDIAGAYGTAIVAAESGTVIEANDYDSVNSWGYYVLIAHNSTYSTRYAHLSSLAVSNGQSVSRGQVIGYEGSTGNSTGPHLHFEVYQNGIRVDPYPFISS